MGRERLTGLKPGAVVLADQVYDSDTTGYDKNPRNSLAAITSGATCI